MRRVTGPHASIDGRLPMAVTTPASARVATRVGVRPARSRRPRSGTALARRARGRLRVRRLRARRRRAARGAAPADRHRARRRSARRSAGCSRARCRCARRPRRGSASACSPASRCGAASRCCGRSRPTRTWAQVNRGVAYTLVVVLAIAVGVERAARDRARRDGWLVVARRVRAVRARRQAHPGRRAPRRELRPHGVRVAPARAAGVLERARRSCACWRCRSRCA